MIWRRMWELAYLWRREEGRSGEGKLYDALLEDPESGEVLHPYVPKLMCFVDRHREVLLAEKGPLGLALLSGKVPGVRPLLLPRLIESLHLFQQGLLGSTSEGLSGREVDYVPSVS